MRETHETLGGNVIPSSYALKMEPNFKTFIFNGWVHISVSIKTPTRKITLNAKDLEISSSTVVSGKDLYKARASLDQKRERLILGLPKPISGKAIITIAFQGKHNDTLSGFYRSKYQYNGKSGYVMTSHFEPSEARTAFPCFDEPELKATYSISMLVDNGIETISNMPVLRKAHEGRKSLVTFATTPRMSTYLVYLGAGKFEFLSDHLGSLKLRVAFTPGKRGLAKLPLGYAKRLIDYQQKYFGIKFPLPKLDVIAIPDFSAGAMENWGAVTFREVVLLGDEKKTSISGKEGIAGAISHEFVHQWFGDLVTMRWWDDLWLNESFATFMGDRSADKVFPEWKIMLDYYSDTISTALAIDALTATHPISVKVNSPEEINSIFDRISYEKGGSVLYMLEDFVGPEIFRKGLHMYLMKNRYSNATKSDLWDAIEGATRRSGKKLPIRRVIQEWIERPGYPVISVRKNPNGTGFLLEQKRFKIKEDEPAKPWPIPVHYLTPKGENRVLMDKQSLVIAEDYEWIKLNYGQGGFYRVIYEPHLLEMLGREIKAKRLGDLDAAGVENDLFVQVRRGSLPLKNYTDFVGKYLMEVGYPANSFVSGHLAWVITIGEGLSLVNDSKRISIRFHKSMLLKTGWERAEGEDVTTTRARRMSIAALGMCEDPETIGKAVSIFNDSISNNVEIDPNIKPPIYQIAAYAQGDSAMFGRMLKQYASSRLPTDSINALQTMGSFKEQKLLSEGLDISLSSKVRPQDAFRIPLMESGNPKAKPILLKWTTKNWQKMKKMFTPVSGKLEYFVSALSLYSDDTSISEIKAFFAKKANAREDIRREVSYLIERLEANNAFIKKNSKE